MDGAALSVVDDKGGAATYQSGDTGNDDVLASGETWIYTVSYTVLSTDSDPLVNIVTVSGGVDLDLDPVPNDTDSNSIDITHAPLLEVVKTNDAGGSAAVGDSITYTFAVSHAAGSDGSDVDGAALSVVDDKGGAATYQSGDTGNDDVLASGETWIYTVSYTVLSTDSDPLVNIVTVSGGVDLDLDPVPNDTDSNSIDITHAPLLEVVKTNDAGGSAAVGDSITYTFAVSHAAGSDGSDVDGAALSVVDDKGGAATYQSGDTGNDDVLASGETWIYTVSYTVLSTDSDPLVNIVTVSGGVDLDLDPVPNDTDSNSIDITHAPLLEVVKTNDAGGSAAVGDSITYTFAVSHAAGSDGSDVDGAALSVVDDKGGAATYQSGDTGNDDVLASGETWIYTVSYTVLSTDSDPLVNIVTVSGGVDLDLDPVPNDPDSNSIDITHAPLLEVVKTNDAGGSAAVGDSITYTFAVSHAAGSDGSDVDGAALSVVDDKGGAATYQSGDTGNDDVLASGGDLDLHGELHRAEHGLGSAGEYCHRFRWRGPGFGPGAE